MQFTFEQILEAVRNLPEADKERLRKELFSKKDPIEELIMESFKEYEKVFRALA